MKKLIGLLLVLTMLLTACNVGSVSIEQTFEFPNNVQEAINSDNTLQLISDGVKNGYIVFQSGGIVTVEFEVVDKVLMINFVTKHEEEGETKQYVYKMTPNVTEINVSINGKTTSFNTITDL